MLPTHYRDLVESRFNLMIEENGPVLQHEAHTTPGTEAGWKPTSGMERPEAAG
jgi:hypothetical protein